MCDNEQVLPRERVSGKTKSAGRIQGVTATPAPQLQGNWWETPAISRHPQHPVGTHFFPCYNKAPMVCAHNEDERAEEIDDFCCNL